ncbi:heparan-alpha-glucosaminide N-acetyltransferase [Thermoproteota archaeon]
MKTKRVLEIDFLRGIAILMMVVYHFSWNLMYFRIYTADLYSGFWGIFQKLTAGLFIFIVGVSLVLSYFSTIKKTPKKYPSKFLLRGLRVFCYGLIITAFSLLFMPDAFVFFGILHFIGISIILTTPFIRFRYLNLGLGIAALAIGIYLKKFMFSFPWLVWLGLKYPVRTLDLFPILPWIGVVFLGLFIGNLIYPKGKRIFKTRPNKIIEKISQPVRFLGKHALLMYFVHLPVVYGVAYLLYIFA